MLDFPAANDSWFLYLIKNDDIRKIIFIYFESILYGAYNYKVS